MHLVVHAGPYKTGSTSIQASLTRARKAIQDGGCYCFGTDDLSVRALVTLFTPEKRPLLGKLQAMFDSHDAARKWSEVAWRKLEETLSSGQYDKAIISSEHIAGLPDADAFFARLRRIASRITVVFYVRDPVDLFASSVQQRVRSGARLADLPDLTSYSFPAARQLRRLADAVGQENIIARNFSRRQLVDGDVVADFEHVLKNLGIDAALPRTRVNESLPGAAVALLMAMNETHERNRYSRPRERLLRRMQKSEVLAELPRMKLTDPLLVEMIRQQTRDECIWINETFLPENAQLTVPKPAAPDLGLSGEQTRVRLRDWLVGYLDHEATQVLLREMVRLKHGPGRKKRKKETVRGPSGIEDGE